MNIAPLQPLAGVRVLELSGYLPGPLAARLLADLGAEVIKVEPPGGDPARLTPPIVGERSAAFAALNFGKRSLALNLKKPEGVSLALALVKQTDVIVESFRPGVLARLGLSYESLVQQQPRLILCSITGYGQNGPLAARAGHDLNFAARLGVLSLNGPAAGPPGMPGVQIADVGGGAMSATIGILAALLERQQTGQGRHLDISMARSAAPFIAMEAGRRAQAKEPRGRGILTGGFPCYRLYQTKDGRTISLGAIEPKFFTAFCAAAGVPHLANDGFATGARGQEVHAKLEALFRTRDQAEWQSLLAEADCCCEPVQPIEAGLADDGLGIATLDLDGIVGILHHLGAPPVTPADPSVPRLGEHGLEVCEELEIDQELVKGAITARALIPPA